MKKSFFTLAIIGLLSSSCTELLQVVEAIDSERPLTQTEVVSGLRQALQVGSDSAAGTLARLNGYYGDQAVKILLPPEAAVITDNLHRIPGGEKLLEDVILRINRAAEDAAREAAPVFVSAIRQMTIQDGFAILRGEQDAATSYLRSTTYDQLFALYQPKLKTSLDKKLVGNISTNESWETLTGQWNRLAGSLAGQIAGLNKVEVQLDAYLTDRALDGLFLKLAEEEEKIRTEPAARVTALLQRVFGSQN